MGLSTINYGFEFVSMDDTLIFTSESERAFLGTLFTIQNGLGSFSVYILNKNVMVFIYTVNLIYGESGVGKMYLLCCLANIIATGLLHVQCSNLISFKVQKIFYIFLINFV
jgi:hypothetical protein